MRFEMNVSCEKWNDCLLLYILLCLYQRLNTRLRRLFPRSPFECLSYQATCITSTRSASEHDFSNVSTTEDMHINCANQIKQTVAHSMPHYNFVMRLVLDFLCFIFWRLTHWNLDRMHLYHSVDFNCHTSYMFVF